MADEPPSNRPRPDAEASRGGSSMRISDSDRDRAVGVLRDHCAEGRLTLEEFSERMSSVLAARTHDDIQKVMSDLPHSAIVAGGVRTPETNWTVAIMSGSSRRGRWRPGARTRVVAFMGGCDLDLRQAEIEGPEVVITAVAFMGGVEIVVPEGFPVHLSGMPMFGGKDLKLADVPTVPGAPLIRVRAFPIFGGVQVHTKRSRRKEVADRLTNALGRDVGDRITDAMGLAARTVDSVTRSFDTATGEDSPSKPEEVLATAPGGTVTILFSDIASFTALTERLGDDEAARLLSVHNELVRATMAAHGGYEVKAQGDGFMVAFAGARRGLRCALEVQRALDRYSRDNLDRPLKVHIGLHAGEAVSDGDDFHGRAVIVASRIADAAGPGEILVSSLMHELTAPSGEFSFADPRQVQLKGITEPQKVYPVVWS